MELSKSLENDEYFTDAYILRGKILWTMGKKKEGNIEFWKAEDTANHPTVKLERPLKREKRRCLASSLAV